MDELLFIIFVVVPLVGTLLLIVIIYSWIKVLGFNNEISILKKQVRDLKVKLKALTKPPLQQQSTARMQTKTEIETPEPSSQVEPKKLLSSEEPPPSLKTDKPKVPPIVEHSPATAAALAASKPVVSRPVSQKSSQSVEYFHDKEPSPAWDWLKENWTGFLGVAAVVLGVAFAATYVGYFASALTRFGMIVVIGLSFIGVSTVLRNRENWRELGAWLQAGGGAILLLAFLGGAYFEGLRFYTTEAQGFVLLMIGLTLNLGLAFLKPVQTLSASHVVLSLLAISVAPSTVPMVWIGALVCVVGVILSHAKQWNLNLAACLIAYSIFSLILGAYHDTQAHWHGIGAALVVFVPSLLVHYRQIYHKDDQVQASMGVHILAWALFGLNLFLYQQGVQWVAIPLGLGALAAIAISLYAKHKQIEWLFTIDFLVGEFLLSLALIASYRFGMTEETIVWMILMQMMLLSFVAIYSNWQRIIKVNFALTGLVLMLYAFVSFDVDPLKNLLQAGALLVFSYGAYSLLQSKIKRHEEPEFLHHSINAFMVTIGFILFVSAIKTQSSWVFWSTALIWVGATLNPILNQQETHRKWSLGFYGVVLTIATLQIVGTVESSKLLQFELPYVFAPLVLAGLFSFRGRYLCFGQNQWVVQYGCYGLAIFNLVVVWKLHLSNAFLPGLIALGVSGLLLEARKALCHMSQPKYQIIGCALSNIGLCALLAFLVFFGVDIIHSQTTIFGIFSIRVLIILLAMMVACLWLWSKAIKNPNHPLISKTIGFDVAVGLLITLNVLELDTPMHGIGYSAIGLIIVLMNHKYLPSRRYLYGCGLLLATLIHVPIVSSSWASPLSNWYSSSHITGPIALIMASGLATVLSRVNFRNDEMQNSFLNGVNEIVHIDKPLVTYVPIFISLGLFLFWRFDGAFLTALWVAEVFLMVMLAMVIRKQSIITVAYGFLLLCLARLVFYDFAQTDLLTKAFVFVAVGLLMIGIHVTYQKLKGRLE